MDDPARSRRPRWTSRPSASKAQHWDAADAPRPPVSFVEEIGDADCDPPRRAERGNAMHALARHRAMVDDVRAWLAGVASRVTMPRTAILSTSLFALRALSEPVVRRGTPVSDRCVTRRRARSTAPSGMNTRGAHAQRRRAVLRARDGHTALNAAGADLCALRDTDATPAFRGACRRRARGRARQDRGRQRAGDPQQREAHAAEGCSSPALAGVRSAAGHVRGRERSARRRATDIKRGGKVIARRRAQKGHNAQGLTVVALSPRACRRATR